MFGYPLPVENRQRYWGARAIFKGCRDNYLIDILSDRQSAEGISDPNSSEDNAFFVWLNERALPWLRTEVKRLEVASDERKEIVLKEFKYELRANPGGSHGYLYIGAVEHPVEELAPHYNEAAKMSERVFRVAETTYVWAADHEPVLPGTCGNVTMNSIGTGRVVGYHDVPYGDTGHRLLCLWVEVDNPPDWMLRQNMNDRAAKEVEAGRLTAKRGTPPEDGIPSPAAFREWKQNFQLGPITVWDGHFKPAA